MSKITQNKIEIRASDSVYYKVDGQLRLTTDLRRINEHCVKGIFVNKNIDQVLDILALKDQLITFDIKNGFISYYSCS